MISDAYIEAVYARRPQPGDIIDAHAHLGPDGCSPYVTHDLARIVAGMERLGVRRMCVSAIPALYGDAGRGNRLVETAITQYPQRFFGYMCADIGYPERILPELARCSCRRLPRHQGLELWRAPGAALRPRELISRCLPSRRSIACRYSPIPGAVNWSSLSRWCGATRG